MRVVVDTSPLIVLERIGRLAVLRELYGRGVRPQSVLDELLAGKERYRLSRELFDSTWMATEPDPPEMALHRELGAGETAAITLAFTTQADLVVLDDLGARIVAGGLGLRITGTLGVLMAARRGGIIDDLDAVLADLQQAGFRIAPELLRLATKGED